MQFHFQSISKELWTSSPLLHLLRPSPDVLLSAATAADTACRRTNPSASAATIASSSAPFSATVLASGVSSILTVTRRHVRRADRLSLLHSVPSLSLQPHCFTNRLGTLAGNSPRQRPTLSRPRSRRRRRRTRSSRTTFGHALNALLRQSVLLLPCSLSLLGKMT